MKPLVSELNWFYGVWLEKRGIELRACCGGGATMIHRKPQPRAPRNHTALVLLPNINDVVTPAPASGSPSLPAISKGKFLDLHSSSMKRNRVLIKRPREDENSVGGSGQISGEENDVVDVKPSEESRRRIGNELEEHERAESTDVVERNGDEVAEGNLGQGLEEWTMPCDTKIALELMRSQFPKVEKSSVPPFVLRSQLYSSVNDRTLVDRELERMKLDCLIRVFKLSTGQDEHAIMLMADYVAQINASKARLAKGKHSPEDMAVFDWFVRHILPVHFDAGITHSKLVDLLSEGGEVRDSHITLLMNAGLLTRQLGDGTEYWLAIPNVGFLLKSLTGGRKEIISFLSRRKYKEMLQVPLERRRLQYSVLGMRFHIRDLLGLGHIHTVNSPSGPIIRLSHD